MGFDPPKRLNVYRLASHIAITPTNTRNRRGEKYTSLVTSFNLERKRKANRHSQGAGEQGKTGTSSATHKVPDERQAMQVLTRKVATSKTGTRVVTPKVATMRDKQHRQA